MCTVKLFIPVLVSIPVKITKDMCNTELFCSHDEWIGKDSHMPVDESPQLQENEGAKLHYLELASEFYTCKVHKFQISLTRKAWEIWRGGFVHNMSLLFHSQIHIHSLPYGYPQSLWDSQITNWLGGKFLWTRSIFEACPKSSKQYAGFFHILNTWDTRT